MDILINLLTIIDVFLAVLIIALVLVQQSKSGGGLGSTFGGGGSESLFGAHASSQLSKLTVVFVTLFLAITLALAIITAHRPSNPSLAKMDSLTKKQEKQEKQKKSSEGEKPLAGVKKDKEDFSKDMETLPRRSSSSNKKGK